jgi:hypothetical protein
MEVSTGFVKLQRLCERETTNRPPVGLHFLATYHSYAWIFSPSNREAGDQLAGNLPETST